MMLFWALMVCINFAILGCFAAQVNEKAHDIGNYIHDIGVFDISKNEDVVQIHMFLSKLNGPPIAFTLWNILPITKEFILTVVGVFITYYALVAQTI
ncbi:uncharacterized protein [Amphiura filiformis]|uniref:uncharacterized protein isoform X2 n=1 Tax=Amphiura filiformis TaxID=82378 RepID=UPI003B20D3DC